MSKLKVLKILNNNSVIVNDIEDQNIEVIVLGKGIAFGKKTGDYINNQDIEKKFVIDKESTSSGLLDLIKEIPLEIIIFSNKMIEYAKNKLDITIVRNIEIPLTDHINFAIERYKKGITITSDLLWEIKRLYPDVYKVSIEIVSMINKEFEIKLPKDEATFIALHFLNSELYGNMDETINATHLIQDILNIIKYYFKREFNEESLSFCRFVTHLKFFANRVIKAQTLNEKDYFLFDFMRLKYEQIYECSLKIQQLLDTKYEYNISDEELTYLMIHIERILADNNDIINDY